MAGDCEPLRNGPHCDPSCILQGDGGAAERPFPTWRFSSMRLTWRRSGRAEDHFETWLAQQHQKRVLESGVASPGPCPNEAFLRDLARKASRISLSDPRVSHAASCPTCINRLLALRGEI